MSAPIAPQTAEARSERVAVITRAVNVEAFRPCSAPTMKYASSARAAAGSGGCARQLLEEAAGQVERQVRLDRLEAPAQAARTRPAPTARTR